MTAAITGLFVGQWLQYPHSVQRIAPWLETLINGPGWLQCPSLTLLHNSRSCQVSTWSVGWTSRNINIGWATYRPSIALLPPPPPPPPEPTYWVVMDILWWSLGGVYRISVLFLRTSVLALSSLCRVICKQMPPTANLKQIVCEFVDYYDLLLSGGPHCSVVNAKHCYTKQH
jgi:hypothetical protein